MSGRGDSNKNSTSGQGSSNQSNQGAKGGTKNVKSNHGKQTGGKRSQPEQKTKSQSANRNIDVKEK